jgi:hypothetical protein
LAALAACSSPVAPGGGNDDAGDDTPPAITGIRIVGGADTQLALREFVRLTPDDRIHFELAPVEPHADELTFDVVIDRDCSECFELEQASARVLRVHAGDVLGAQYGVAALLEQATYRFRHPFDTYIPTELALDPSSLPSGVQSPQVAGPRGLQLHTLHPIEGYLALWEPGADLDPARRIFDWIIKNRGNYVQWPALDDIMSDSRHATWKAATQQLLEAAHERGLGAGLSIQMFGSSNLQRAFDLSDDDDVPLETSLAERLPRVTADLPFDRYSLSFGEFFGSEPATFISAINTTTNALRAARPGVTIHASIHVGGDLRVDYGGENLPYYFLVKFADPAIVPNLHTVMYYNLFEDAGGAYEQDNFHEHRDYLLARMRQRQPAVYYPETAYWVAFDNSVPLFLPTYVRSRWLDLDGIARLAQTQGGDPLHGHLIFSSGFEWGYWLNDVASLRASWSLPASYGALIADAFGADLAAAAPLVDQLAAIQADALIDNRLAAYLAGRDALIDGGDAAGIHSQPDRITFGELRAQPWRWSSFQSSILTPLTAHATQLESLHAQAVALGLADSRWSRELIDALDVTAARARFVVSAYEAIVTTSSSVRAAARARMATAYARGEAAVRRRHADFHDADPRLTSRFTNATVYQFGYHYQTDTLCYWRREMAEIAVVLDGDLSVPPTCAY